MGLFIKYDELDEIEKMFFKNRKKYKTCLIENSKIINIVCFISSFSLTYYLLKIFF